MNTLCSPCSYHSGRRTRGITWFALWTLSASIVGCLSVGRASPPINGFLLPGPQAASAFGIAASDTLPEIGRDAVPQPATEAAVRAAQQHEKRADCNRFFQAHELYVVVLSAFCGNEFGKETDSRTLVGIRSTGTVVATISWAPQTGVAQLQPYMRW